MTFYVLHCLRVSRGFNKRESLSTFDARLKLFRSTLPFINPSNPANEVARLETTGNFCPGTKSRFPKLALFFSLFRHYSQLHATFLPRILIGPLKLLYSRPNSHRNLHFMAHLSSFFPALNPDDPNYSTVTVKRNMREQKTRFVFREKLCYFLWRWRNKYFTHFHIYSSTLPL